MTHLLTQTEMRLDIYLSDMGLASSRSEAKRLIDEGAVSVNGRVIMKPSCDVGDNDKINVERGEMIYVSRGGIKLAGALDVFKINVNGREAIDVGASSGGFSDCLLKKGAKRVIAVDSGSAQLVSKLREDPRVISIENYNARYINSADLPYLPDIAVMDVSFISATYIIPSLSRVLRDNADFVCLIKPQFEVGRENVGKGGIVKDERARKRAVDRVVACAIENGLSLREVITSPIKGGDGNVEFLAHFVKDGKEL